MSRKQLKRSHQLVAMCTNLNNNVTDETMESTHSHFNEEPLPYEWPLNELPHTDPICPNIVQMTDIGEAIDKEKTTGDNMTMEKIDSSDLIQLSDLIVPSSGNTLEMYERFPENNCNGDAEVRLDHREFHCSQENTFQVLSSNNVCIEFIDLQDNPELFAPLQPIEVNNTADNIVQAQTYEDPNEEGIILQENFENETLENIENDETVQISNNEKKKSRKRKVNKNNWKLEKRKIARASGKEYKTAKGKLIKKKSICEGALCCDSCRLHCSSYFSAEDRQRLLDEYYSLSIDAKNSILFKSIKPVPVKRRLVAAQKVRRQTFTYHVKNADNEEKQICKRAFMNLYQISVRKIQVIQEKHISGQILPKPDMRGKHENRPKKISPEVVEYIKVHIKSFPAEQSHYSRTRNPNKSYLSPLLSIKQMYKLYIQLCEAEGKENIYHVKDHTYRNIFCTEFNLSFGFPRSDVCSRCENQDNLNDLQIHKETYKEAYELMKFDRNQCSSVEGKLYCTVDIQQTMPLPKIPVGDAFYLRQIWFYNLGIHLASKDRNHAIMCTWTEDVAKKGSFEVSCALHYLAMYLKSNAETSNIKHLTIWSDSCSGQNKNFNLICQYQYMILKEYFEIIDHKFPVVGHTYMDSDRDFGRIEKALRKHEKIYTPEEYRDILNKNISKNSVVVDMKHQLYDVEAIQKDLKLINRTKNTLGDKVEFRDEVKWIRIEKFGSYMYKKSYDPNTPFLMVDLSRKGSVITPDDVEIKRLTNLRGEVSDEKKNDIRKQLQYIPIEKRFFYENILNN